MPGVAGTFLELYLGLFLRRLLLLLVLLYGFRVFGRAIVVQVRHHFQVLLDQF